MRRLFCLMAVCILLISSASAYSIDPEYAVGSSNLTIFQGVAERLPYGVHYVYWRNGRYEYCMAYGNTLSVSGSNFTGSNCTVITYYTYTGNGTQATWNTASVSNFSLNASSYLVWSDLGDYPTLYDRGGVDYVKTVCIILCSFALYYLFHHMWGDIRQRYLDD